MKIRTMVMTAVAAILIVSGIFGAVNPSALYADTDAPQVVGSEAKFNELFKELAESQKEQRYINDFWHFWRWDALDEMEADEDAVDSGSWSVSLTGSSERAAVSTDSAMSATPAVASPQVAAEVSAGELTPGHSTTNNQVEGVDEADIIKTDGQYIYHLTNNNLHIIKTDGKGKMEKLSTTGIGDDGVNYFLPNDMYVDGDTVCLIGWATHPSVRDNDPRISYRYNAGFTKVVVYDIKNRAKPGLKREFYVEGYAVSSRKIDNILYLITNHYMNFYNVNKPSDIVPMFSDSAAGDAARLQPISFSTMRYFPDKTADSILVICGLDIADPKAEAKVESVLGSGSNVFMSRTALYVTQSDYNFNIIPLRGGVFNRSEEMTTFYKFGLKDGKATYQAQATLPGHVLNQYSMDEHNGYFRVAMTTDQHDSENSKNTLTILNDKMKQAGIIENMAPGERIYSARFMGDRAFMVTFRTVDPLFAMDLSDPYNPKLMGELKIPGYSTYLHPYDENHLIGFGRDTDEWTTTDSSGKVIDVRAVNKGLKISLFDISDMKNPKEVSVDVIGNEYTHSDLLYNPKAWLFDKEKGFVAFPVYHINYDWGIGRMNTDQFDSFNGIYVYDIDTTGLKQRGRIAINEGKNTSGQDHFGRHIYDNLVQRIIYIGDTFYTAFASGMQANEMESLKYIRVLRY